MKLILFYSFYAAGQSSTSSESSHSVMEHFSNTLRSISTLIRPQTSCTLCLKSTKPSTNLLIRWNAHKRTTVHSLQTDRLVAHLMILVVGCLLVP